MHAPSRCWAVLSIAKLRVGQEAYHLSGVAQSLDAYYTGVGEADGAWVGGGAARLGLEGLVAADDLRAVLAGLAPGRGGFTPNGTEPRSHPRRVPGFDLTFKTPKSASVLYAVSDDPRVQGAVIEAGERAMRAAVGWLEREAIQVQRGSHNLAWLAKQDNPAQVGPRRLPTSGVVAASFRHRTSRASDPLLHWHVLVANLVEGADGKWSAFAHPDLYRHVRAAGEVFQAVYRDELTASLGVEWRPGRHVPEIAGIPQTVLDMFSKRSREIDAWLAATGTPNDAAGRQEAVLATRRHKPEMEGRRFDEAWKLEAAAAGWGPDQAEHLIARCTPRVEQDIDELWRLEHHGIDDAGQVEAFERVVDPEEWIADLLRTDLTHDRTTFTTADVTRAVAARQGAGASMATIERITACVLASDQTIAVHQADRSAGLWTSREMLDTERRFAELLTTRSASTVEAAAVDQASMLVGSLGADQQRAMRCICASDASVSVLIGPAGTGKTYTVDAIRTAFEHAGYRVVGAAPSARAAIELAAGAHIDTHTLHALHRRWDTGIDTPDHTLLVIDEAGMADIRTLTTTIARQTAAGGRVLLVGDHHQLPEVGAGGGFAYATQHARTVAELTINRRQRHEWEQAALAELRTGSIPTAVAAYLNHQRVLTADTPAEMINVAVDTWFTARDHGQRPVLLAGTNEIVDALNAAVVGRLIEQGELPPESAGYGGGEFRVGERVVIRRNGLVRTVEGDDVSVANGQAGTLTDVTAASVLVALDTGQHVELTGDYLRHGGQLTHAYALTTHRAQGGTWDLGIAVGADGLYREGAFVELSRGTHSNWIVLTAPEAAQLARDLHAESEIDRHDHGLNPDPTPTVEEDLTTRMGVSRAKQLTHTIDPDAEIIDWYSRNHTLAQLEQHTQTAYQAEHAATDIVGADDLQLVDAIARLEFIARHLDIGIHVSPHDRHNIGTVTGVDDLDGTATVHFTSRDGTRHATHIFHWADLRIVEPHTPTERPLTATATNTLDHSLTDITDKLTRRNGLLDDHGVRPGDLHHYQRATERHILRHAARLGAERPGWLTDLIGDRPGDIAGARAWDDAVREITIWRLRHELTDDFIGLGTRPADTDIARDWTHLSRRIGLTRTWLDTTDRQEPAWPTTPSYSELVARTDELDRLFATAPADYRQLITELQTGQLSLDDTTHLLTEALAHRTARQNWIIEHWPHIVEYQEANRTLATGTWGPDPELLHTLPASGAGASLADAVDRYEPWLRAALCAVADRNDTTLDIDAVRWLDSVADYRSFYRITSTQPLGPTDPTDEQRQERRMQLHRDLEAFEQIHHDRLASVIDPAVTSAALDGIDL
ncbi:MAG: conjugative relaxase [Ilumatobacteraceae bacterium]|nr:conjugative relaxase [Ilumatobacteraceae bacterium]